MQEADLKEPQKLFIFKKISLSVTPRGSATDKDTFRVLSLEKFVFVVGVTDRSQDGVRMGSRIL
jgi:hypothetical protein